MIQATYESFPLHQAAGRGDCAAVSHLLAADASIETRDRGALTPLHVAASFGRAEVVDLLLSARADTRAMTLNGRPATALHLAVGNGNAECVRALAAGGAELNSAILLHAAKRGRFGLCTWMLEASVDPNNRGGLDGEDALQCLILSKPGEAKTATQLCLATRAFLDHGYDTLARDKRGATAVHAAAQVGAADILHLLLRGRANPNAQHELRDAWTALHLAAAGNRTHAVKVLLDSRAEPWLVDAQGRTALDVARPKVREMLMSLPGAPLHAGSQSRALGAGEASSDEEGPGPMPSSSASPPQQLPGQASSRRFRSGLALTRRVRGLKCLTPRG